MLSFWTIDLCYILKHYNVEHVYFTKTPGVDPNLANEVFYQGIINQVRYALLSSPCIVSLNAQCLVKDEARVKNRFETADSNGVAVQIGSLALQDLLLHLQDEGPAIVLIDSSILQCETCVSICSTLTNALKQIVNIKLPYRGHYIVLCGLDRSEQKISYRNPSLRDSRHLHVVLL